MVCFYTIHKKLKSQDNNIPVSNMEPCNQWMPRLLCRILHTVLNSFAQLYVPACIAGVSYKSNKIFKKETVQLFGSLPFLGTYKTAVGPQFTRSVCMICSIELDKNILQPNFFHQILTRSLCSLVPNSFHLDTQLLRFSYL